MKKHALVRINHELDYGGRLGIVQHINDQGRGIIVLDVKLHHGPMVSVFSDDVDMVNSKGRR